MKGEAAAWAAEQRLSQPMDKLVLWALAVTPSADKLGVSYPSVKAICFFTGMGRTAVMGSLARLVRAGLICDSGERVGITGQIKVWRLALNSLKGSARRTVQASASRTLKGSAPRMLSASQRVRETDTEPSSYTDTGVSALPQRPVAKP